MEGLDKAHMKKQTFLLLLCLSGLAAHAQSYYVTYIKGAVYSNGKPLKLRDKVDGASMLSSPDKSAVVALFDIQKGEYRLNFRNAIPQPTGTHEKTSGIYQVIVQNFLQPYTTEGTLTARGKFDLLTFFNYTDTLHGGNRILLISGQPLPVASDSLKTQPEDHFYLCRVQGRDTIARLVPRTRGELLFTPAFIAALGASGDILYLVRLGYKSGGKAYQEYFPDPVAISFISPDDLKAITIVYTGGLAGRYQHDKLALRTAIKAHLQSCYGNFYEPYIDRLLNQYIP